MEPTSNIAICFAIASVFIYNVDITTHTNTSFADAIANTTSAHKPGKNLRYTQHGSVLMKLFESLMLFLSDSGIGVVCFIVVVTPILVRPLQSTVSTYADTKASTVTIRDIKTYEHSGITNFVEDKKFGKMDEHPLTHLVTSITFYACVTILIINSTWAFFKFDLFVYLNLGNTVALSIGLGARDVLTNVILGLTSSNTIKIGLLCEYSPSYENNPLATWDLIEKNTMHAPRAQVVRVSSVSLTGVVIIFLPFLQSDAESKAEVPSTEDAHDSKYTRTMFVKYDTFYSRCVILDRVDH
jgi:hypothetical protein